MFKSAFFRIALVVCALTAAPVFADGGNNSNSKSKLDPYHELIEQQQFEQAIKELEVALDDDPDDADLLNLMAYSHRKLGLFDIAMNFYQKALQLEPKHRGANEYLGELYLQLGQPGQAEQRLAVLDKACFFGCKEYTELKRAIAKYREENPS